MPKPNKNGHIRMECTDPSCNGCNLCHLFLCMICGGAEGSLPSQCPETKMTYDQDQAVLNNTLDYKNGKWVILIDGKETEEVT